MLSRIVIDAEAHGDSQTMLRLSIDKHLVAENLTAAQARFLIEEILDRIPVAEVGKTGGTIEQQSSGSRVGIEGREIVVGALPSPAFALACGPRQEDFCP